MNALSLESGGGTSRPFSEGTATYTGYEGGDGAHNIMQPYEAVYLWRRTA
jgi:hypothetical protein